MSYFQKWTVRLLMVTMLLAGCSLHKEILPHHDEILLYNLPYDLTYLRTFEALESIEGWDVESTVKEKGIIQVKNVKYARLDDSDKRIVHIWITRKNRFQTSVQLAPDSQRTIGGGELLQNISQFLSREL